MLIYDMLINLEFTISLTLALCSPPTPERLNKFDNTHRSFHFSIEHDKLSQSNRVFLEHVKTTFNLIAVINLD